MKREIWVISNWSLPLQRLRFSDLFRRRLVIQHSPVGPLLQDGVALNEALVDGFYSVTASLTVIESIAITMNLWLVREAPMGGILFWTVLVLSLLVGLLAAYPVNVLLVTSGVKKGMMNPTMID